MSKPKSNLRPMLDAPEPQADPAPALAVSPAAAKTDCHPGKKSLMIHIVETMHKHWRAWRWEEAIPLSYIIEWLLREVLVKKVYTQHAAK